MNNKQNSSVNLLKIQVLADLNLSRKGLKLLKKITCFGKTFDDMLHILFVRVKFIFPAVSFQTFCIVSQVDCSNIHLHFQIFLFCRKVGK